MSIVNDFHRPAGITGKESRSLFGGLQQAAQRIADLRRGNSPFKTMDLVNILLCQAARTRRAAMPQVNVRIHSGNRNGVSAVRLKIS
ncbi:MULTISPECIES: hypothetical protein [unclassified Phyllobacterium]|uniref:hypothetical protein n=1 Tax=Phyllobacterium TaxID=28100 RepID=UPI000DD61BD7|nr:MULTISPECIES: hypothetical protein [unclassified Phyllobacterium]MBA8902764.1 hypothetical protein [Phyllobacterium sp. P30BS-XVII]UGX87527.1 hypothetical protein LLE53_006815 [Phyllobacterium sp. T1293]